MIEQIRNESSSPINTYRGFHLPLGVIALLHWALGVLCSTLLLAGMVWSHEGSLESHYRLLMIGVLLTSYVIYSAFSVYSFELTRSTLATRITSAWTAVGASLMLLGFLSGTYQNYSPPLVLTWFLASWCLQVLVAIILKSLIEGYAAKNAKVQSAIIVGTSQWADNISHQLIASPQWHLVGFIRETSDSNTTVNHELPDSAPPVLGDVSQLREVVEAHNVRRIFIALPADDPTVVQRLYVDLLDTTADIVWVVRHTSMLLFNQAVDSFEGARAVYLNASPLTSYPSSVFVKHLGDRITAASLLVILSPLLLILAIGVKLSSRGPIFFVQERHGLNAQPFNMWKFRSMRLHADDEVKQATANDTRVTAIGRLLRKTSMDELPQLINVLKGDMSLVGPRPHATQHNDYYAGKLTAYMTRHRVKPGITGLAQVKGFRGETETLEKMQARLEYDLEYINNWSLKLDWEILLKTPRSVLEHEAY